MDDKESVSVRVIDTGVSETSKICQSIRVDEKYGESNSKSQSPI